MIYKSADREVMSSVRDRLHDTCILCGGKNPVGLKLRFEIMPDSGTRAEFTCSPIFEGYRGFMHGGVAASLMDSAMTNCLFAHNIAAFTAEMDIKYNLPVLCGKKAIVTARIIEYLRPLYILEAEIMQEGKTVVKAKAKFMESELLKK